MRILNWTNLDELAAGTLVQALGDWESPEAPPVNLLFRPSVRRNPRVRLFIDFVTDLFREVGGVRGQVGASGRSGWLGKHYGKASAILTRGR